MIKKMPLGEQSFKKIREKGLFYVDKTQQIQEMLDWGVSYFFMSRPRRFGKSLLIDTMKHIFLGNKELFKGKTADENLYIYNHGYDFKKHAIIHISFAEYTEGSDLKEFIGNNGIVYINGEETNLNKLGFGVDLGGAIMHCYKKTKNTPVVILIDEYDKPILSELKGDLLEKNRKTLADMYSPLKNMGENIRLCYISGLTKVMKMSIFSAFNNLIDLSYRNTSANILGYTEMELKKYFNDEIFLYAKNNRVSIELTYNVLKKRYNGYNFGDIKNKVYNPWNINNFIDTGIIDNYWSKTGVPTAIDYLITFSKEKCRDFIEKLFAEGIKISSELLSISDFNDKNTVPILFYNAGYLTVVNDEDSDYTMDFPNEETRKVMNNFLTSKLVEGQEAYFKRSMVKIRNGFINRNENDISKGIYEMFYVNSTTPYDWIKPNPEGYMKGIISMFWSQWFGEKEVIRELHGIKGSSDIIFVIDNTAYLVEFKVNENVATAQSQIKTTYKDILNRFQREGKIVLSVGINWNKENNIITTSIVDV